jgi:hypothetical protein
MPLSPEEVIKEALNSLIEQKNQEIKRLQAEVDRWRPVIDLVGLMVQKWSPFFDRLPDGEQEIIRAYQRAMKGEKKSEGIHNSGSNQSSV